MIKQEYSHIHSGRTLAFRNGIKDGIPIGIGYFAVSFSLGITAQKAGLTAFQGFLASLLINASAGEYAAFTLIAADAAYIELFLITLITNARYLLMSCALSQKFSPDTSLFHRLLIGYDITDEIFAVSISRPGYLNPYCVYGTIAVALPSWALGTAAGIISGSILPFRVVSALGVALYGMLIAVIIPPARKDKVIAVLILICFAASYTAASLPLTAAISEGTRTIVLTIIISAGAALLFPVKEETK